MLPPAAACRRCSLHPSQIEEKRPAGAYPCSLVFCGINDQSIGDIARYRVDRRGDGLPARGSVELHRAAQRLVLIAVVPKFTLTDVLNCSAIRRCLDTSFRRPSHKCPRGERPANQHAVYLKRSHAEPFARCVDCPVEAGALSTTEHLYVLPTADPFTVSVPLAKSRLPLTALISPRRQWWRQRSAGLFINPLLWFSIFACVPPLSKSDKTVPPP